MFYTMSAFLLKTEAVGTLGQNKACSTELGIYEVWFKVYHQPENKLTEGKEIELQDHRQHHVFINTVTDRTDLGQIKDQ